MIDVENEIFNIIASEIKKEYTEAFVISEYVKTPPKFPCVSLIEMDNYSYQKTEDSGSNENHISVMYELNIYSNKQSGKKSECKKLASLIDGQMLALGFARIMLQPIPNINDATIYRMVGRYSAVISKNKEIYRR